MRNVRNRIPFEQYAFSQTQRVRKKQFKTAYQIGIEEDEYLDEMNQFYLDYQKFESTKESVNKLQQVQHVFHKGNIVKSSIKRVFFDQLMSRQQMAMSLINMPLVDNLQLQKDILLAESELAEYKKTLQERSSLSYFLNEPGINNLYIANVDMYLFNQRESEIQNSHYRSLQNKILNHQSFNQIQENSLQKREIYLDNQIGIIDSQISQIKNVIEEINADYLQENEQERRSTDFENYNLQIEKDLKYRRKNFEQEVKQIELAEESFRNDQAQKQQMYEELELQFNNLLEQGKAVIQLKSKLVTIQEEKIKNRRILYEKEREYFELTRQLNQQQVSIRIMNKKTAEKKNDVFELQSQCLQKQNQMQRKSRKIQSLIKHLGTLENELEIQCKVMDVKLKNLNFGHNKIEPRTIGLPSPRRPSNRLLRLDNLGLNSKSRRLKKDENALMNEV